MALIRQDGVSKTLTVLVAADLVFLVTAPPAVATLALIISVITLFGLTLPRLYNFQDTDAPDTAEGTRKITVYTVGILFIFFVLNLFVPRIPSYLLNAGILLSGSADARAFGYLIAVAESQWFQGFLGNYFIGKAGPTVGSMAVGVVATVYHLFVYGTSGPALLIVFGAFYAMTWFCWRAGRVSPALLAHVINNVAFG